MNKITAIILSILLHLIVLYLVAQHLRDNSRLPLPASPEQKTIRVELITPNSLSSSNEMQGKSTNSKPKYVYDKKICELADNTYIGVGIIFAPFNDTISYAPEQYPAHKAGIRVGDTILNPVEPIIDGYIKFEIMRGIERFVFNVKAEKICYQEISN